MDQISAVTRGIKVSVRPRYEAASSLPAQNKYVHSYQVTIHNMGESSVQLLRREWIITDGDGSKRVVRGDGVIGEQPVIAPGFSHTYSSWCPLSFPAGKMEGHYEMQDQTTEEVFQARVPMFKLTADFKQN